MGLQSDLRMIHSCQLGTTLQRRMSTVSLEVREHAATVVSLIWRCWHNASVLHHHVTVTTAMLLATVT